MFFANLVVKSFRWLPQKLLTAKIAEKSREGRKENLTLLFIPEAEAFLFLGASLRERRRLRVDRG